ncbi:uncharacterized protein LOC116733493 [Xiphophorus hellerii]|uniref:uncharacterized protein LOC116733493 n=1 Tax=Xiphophorus hellerii TaxID=8084 RepID=UPI0013B42BE2|nr:uncharacterized protein LOC116733493 [Xiphophorus hellerii]
MQQVVWISLVLLNVVWISFFLTPDLDFSVFVQRRSNSSSDETFMMEFCLQPELKAELDLMSTSATKWTSTESSARGPDEDINIITELTVIAEQDLKQTEMFGSADQNNPSTQTDHEANRDLDEHTPSSSEVSRSIGPQPAMAPNKTPPRVPQPCENFPDTDMCCIKFTNRKISVATITQILRTTELCSLKAFVLVTRTKKMFCISPDHIWLYTRLRRLC